MSVSSKHVNQTESQSHTRMRGSESRVREKIDEIGEDGGQNESTKKPIGARTPWTLCQDGCPDYGSMYDYGIC